MSEQPSESARQAIVPDTSAGRRFDAVVAELFPEYSRSRLTEWIKAGDVLLDGAQARPRDALRGGEVVTLQVVLEAQTTAEPEDIPLDVLFEDEHLLVINKPVGLVVHPGAGNHSGTWSMRCCTATRRWRCCRVRASCIAWTRTPAA